MRSFLFLLFVATLCGGTLSAQAFGVRAGVNLTNLNINVDGASISFDNQTNLMLGLFCDLPVGGEKFMLSPELSYAGRGYNSNLDFLGTVTETKVNFAYLDLGVLAKYMLVDNESVGVYIAAGPVLSYALSGSVDTDGDKADIDFNDDDTGFNRSSFNLAGAAGLTFGQKFFVEGRYMAGLSSLNDDDDDGTSKWTSIGLNGGIRIPLGN